jgi:uncharacterized protein YxjI
MRYIMKQKLISWGDDYTIKTADEQDAYFVDGKAISLGSKASLQDMNGNELAFISQKLLAWGPTYEIYRNGELAAVIKKELFTFFKCTFTVDVPGPDDLTAVGELTDHEYTFRRGDTEVAHVSKQWFTWSDTYGVEINEGEDAVLLLACAVVVDMACHDHRKRQ